MVHSRPNTSLLFGHSQEQPKHVLCPASVVKLVDTRDLKSRALTRRAGSSPARGTNKNKVLREQSESFFAASNFTVALW
jgi:hypothetical protein